MLAFFCAIIIIAKAGAFLCSVRYLILPRMFVAKLKVSFAKMVAFFFVILYNMVGKCCEYVFAPKILTNNYKNKKRKRVAQ